VHGCGRVFPAVQICYSAHVFLLVNDNLYFFVSNSGNSILQYFAVAGIALSFNIDCYVLFVKTVWRIFPGKKAYFPENTDGISRQIKKSENFYLTCAVNCGIL
jgi:hypothetical protein